MKKKGFTLIELIAVIAMVAIISLVVMSLMLSQNKMFTEVNNETTAQDQTRTTFSVLEDDLMVGKNKVHTTPGIVGSISINGTIYNLPTVNGSSTGKVVYGLTKTFVNPSGGTVDKECAYILYGKVLIFAMESSSGNNLEVLSTLSKDINSINISQNPTTKEYILDLNIKKGSVDEKYKTVVTPRN